ncbi:MAG: cbb3-type cytochrome c oxidase subunit I [Clostridia bacterium]|nr:cbb3-type cytochrome c oxidase subunit I [Clostridia bacterium]
MKATQAVAAGMRRCPVTGLQVDRAAERLIRANAVTAVLYLAAGGIMALLLALTRWQVVHLLPAEAFYALVTAHGATMLVFWILFFEVAGLLFGGTVLLNARTVAPAVGWLAYALMLAGSLLAEYTMLTGQATVMFTAYPPLAASPLFYAGILVFAVGALVAVVHFFMNVVGARLRGDVGGTLPLFTFALLAAAILALFTLVSGAAALLPLFLWSIGLREAVDPGVYRLLYWGFGHGAQQVNLAAMVGVWYALASLTTGARPLNEGLSRFAFLLYILFIQMGSMHHLLVDPANGTWARGVNTSYFMYAAVLGSMIHAFTIPASVEVAQREQGFGRGLWSWLRRAPWGEPGFAALAVSLVLFGIMGGISGVIMGTMQVNLIAHNTLIVPAHFHMTVVGGTTLAFMGIAYYLVPLIFQRQLILPGWARIQPYVFGAGMAVLGLGMGYAGHLGVPRRHWDITVPGSPLPVDAFRTPAVDASLAVMAAGALLAILGGAMFVIVAAGTVLVGRRTAAPDVGRVMPEAFGLAAISGGSEPEAGAVGAVGAVGAATVKRHEGFEAPGTLVITSAWLALFVVLYAISWAELGSSSWWVR